MEFIDQMGNVLTFSETPKRIVSLVPSQTELLYHLGVVPVGQTIFCVHPNDAFKSATKIGGTKKLRLDAIRSLKPDLIIGNKEENEKAQIEELQDEFPVWMSDVNTIDEAYDMITRIGAVIDKRQESINLKLLIQNSLNQLVDLFSGTSVAYVIWQNPTYAVGKHTFIHDVLRFVGLQNVVSGERYPELSTSSLQNLNPRLIFLSSEPFPFKDEHIKTFQEICPNSRVVLVDGEMFSWYGSHMTQLSQYLIDLKKSLDER